MIVTLSADERRRVQAVLDVAGRATSIVQLLETTLSALDEYLGFGRSAFMLALAERPFPGRRAYAGVTYGSPPCVLEEYFERWADLDAFGSDPARAAFFTRGRASIHGVYRSLDSPHRRFVDDFLVRTDTPAQLAHRLPVGWTDAYVTVMATEEHTARDAQLAGAVARELQKLLRPHLPRGLEGGLSVRESQTAELVALGFSNREIASVLHVEEDTVKKHVSHALTKLGLERRTSLAVAWATGRRMDVNGARAQL
jgi:DNA-binding CsgD family transcriptional regulator